LAISQVREFAAKGGGSTGVIALLAWGYAAIVGFVFGGVISAILGAIVGVMAWTPVFTERRAQGLNTLSDFGRVGVGLVCLIGSVAMLPVFAKTWGIGSDGTTTPTALTERQASAQCQEATLDKLNHPSTAGFNDFDTTFRQAGDESNFTITLTAKNGFGLELKLLATCVFDGRKIILNQVHETR